jgi:hypothetical protein
MVAGYFIILTQCNVVINIKLRAYKYMVQSGIQVAGDSLRMSFSSLMLPGLDEIRGEAVTKETSRRDMRIELQL